MNVKIFLKIIEREKDFRIIMISNDNIFFLDTFFILFNNIISLIKSFIIYLFLKNLF